jgi:hypothetical protein
MEDGGIWSEERKGLAPSTNAFLFPNHWKPSRYRVTGADGSEREKVRGDSVFADGSGVYMSSETELASMPAYIEKAQTVWEVIYCKFFIVQCFQCFVVCLVCNFGFTYGACRRAFTVLLRGTYFDTIHTSLTSHAPHPHLSHTAFHVLFPHCSSSLQLGHHLPAVQHVHVDVDLSQCLVDDVHRL